MDKKSDSLYKVLIDSLFECKESFTKEELKEKMEERDIEVKNIEWLMEFLLQHQLILSKNEECYEVTVEHAFNKVYGNKKAR